MGCICFAARGMRFAFRGRLEVRVVVTRRVWTASAARILRECGRAQLAEFAALRVAALSV